MSSRYLIGLDLGTTNSAVAYIDTRERPRGGRPPIRRFAIPQIVRPGEVESRETLPSFLYFPTPDDQDDVGENAGPVVGTYARDHGALVPGRQVTSAKSWLCNPAVDRRADVLPWGHGENDPSCSPVAASARYLAHIRDAWNQSQSDASQPERFDRQQIILTVPASFDEEARELTVAAASEAGLENVTLLEEPLAAFYAWIATHAQSFGRLLADGDRILVCDVGGGTTDFTLIRTTFDGGTPAFERTAVGEHLLLGGDNLDLALARLIQSKLGNVRLTLRQQQALARLTSAAKETLLGENPPERLAIAVPAAGSSIVGGRLVAEIARGEVLETLRAGFLPDVRRDDLPARSTRTGLREFGLPYAAEPAITRHLAAFLWRAGAADGREGAGPVRPDAILFNGGFFTPAVARDAVMATLSSWFQAGEPGWSPKVLANRSPATAVATGAAYYAYVREHGGVRISGGTARGYYIGLRSEPAATTRGVIAVCVMPRGTEEGTELDLSGRTFSVATNRPVAFPLYSSTTRNDNPGEVAELDPDTVHQHAPLTTILRYGKKSRQADLPVHLTARFTEVGTLEIWCRSNVSEHGWRLQFELRATEQSIDQDEIPEDRTEGPEDRSAIVISDNAVERAAALVRSVFSATATGEEATPETLVARIESELGYARQAWPLTVIRRLADVLIEGAEGRRKAPRFEARWLNLIGFCLRPGFGASLDKWRVEQLRRVYAGGLSFPSDLQNQSEWLVLWQRVAGGLTAGQQQELYQRNRTLLGVGTRKDVKRLNPQVEREGWRLLASLELLSASTRASLGQELLERVNKRPDNTAFLWSLGRLGARIPSYGPLNTVVPAEKVSHWIDALLGDGVRTAKRVAVADRQAAIVQMAARTEDPHRDIDDGLRERVVAYLEASGASPDDVERVRSYVPPAAGDAIRMFGEALPEGLRL